MSYDTRLLTSHPMFEFTTLFCTIDDFFQKNEAIYWQYLIQVISLGFMHPYVLIKSAIRISLNLQRCETRLIHDSG